METGISTTLPSDTVRMALRAGDAGPDRIRVIAGGLPGDGGGLGRTPSRTYDRVYAGEPVATE